MPLLKLGLYHQNTMISNIMKTRSKINNNHWEYKYFTYSISSQIYKNMVYDLFRNLVPPNPLWKIYSRRVMF